MTNSSTSPACRLLFYCEHPILATGLNALLAVQDDFVLQVTRTRGDTISLLREQQPDVLLLNLQSDFDLGFLDDIKKVAASCKIVIWADAISTEIAFQVYSAGVRGIIEKTLSQVAFLMHLRSVREGNFWIDKSLMNRIDSSRTVRLTPREAQLVLLLAQGLKNKEIATELKITENTVKAYLSHLFQKLCVKDRLDLALFGLKNLGGAQNLLSVETERGQRNNVLVNRTRSFTSILMTIPNATRNTSVC